MVLQFPSGFPEEESDIEMHAEKVEYNYETGQSVLTGSVNLQYKGTVIRADEARLSPADKKGEATGDVMILDGTRVFFCDSIQYDFQNKTGLMTSSSTLDGPWILTADHVQQTENGVIRLSCTRICLCPKERPHFYLTAREVQIRNNSELKAKHVVVWLGPVPVFYWPVYKRQLDGSGNFVGIRIGHTSHSGVQILTSLNFSPSDHLSVKGKLDWHQKRGVGLGVDARFRKDGNNSCLSQYYIHDRDFVPTRSLETPGEKDRSRLKFEDSRRLGNIWNSNLEFNYFSDADLLQDFFYDEFDQAIQPDTRYRISRTTDRTSMGAILRVRVNDYEQVLERLPQFYFDLIPLEIGGNLSNLFFSSTNQAGFLRQQFSDDAAEGYDSFRLYSKETFDYSKKFFGWLTFNPSLSLEAAGYSKSKDPVTNAQKEESLLRISELFSATFSTSLYKVYEPPFYCFGSGRFLHVLTPSVTYGYRSRPDKENEEVLQFDELDNRSNMNVMTVELISRWQVKEQSDPLINNIYSISYDLENEESRWGHFNLYSQIRLTRDFKMDFLFDYNTEEKETQSFRSDLSWRYGNKVGLSLGYWNRLEKDNLVIPEFSLNISDDIFIRTYFLYNDGTDKLERSEIILVKSMHCMDVAMRYMVRDNRDERMIYFTVSPKNYSTGGLRFG